jgi:hypothetical protein
MGLGLGAAALTLRHRPVVPVPSMAPSGSPA